MATFLARTSRVVCCSLFQSMPISHSQLMICDYRPMQRLRKSPGTLAQAVRTRCTARWQPVGKDWEGGIGNKLPVFPILNLG